MLRTLYGDHKRYLDVYFSKLEGMYFAGDGAKLDEDGYWWVLGRVDDVLNVAGHRIGTMEVESALVSHPMVAEAAAVGKPDDLKGQALVVFVTLKGGKEATRAMKDELTQHIDREIGKFARPDAIRFTDAELHIVAEVTPKGSSTRYVGVVLQPSIQADGSIR